MADTIVNGTADITRYVVMRDATTKAPKADVTVTDIDLYYQEQGAAQSAKADVTALDAANSAHADNKAYHCGNAEYRVDWPDAAFDGGAGKIVDLIYVCSGCETVYERIHLVSATRGLAGTSLPDAAADAPGGLPISDGGGLDLDTYIKRLEAAFTSTIAGYLDAAISTRAPETGGALAALATTVGAAGAGLTAVPWNAAWDAQAQSECADAITAAGLATDVNLNNWMALMATAAELAKVPKSDGVVSWNATALAAIRTAIGLAGANLDAQLGDIPNNAEFAAALAAADDAVLAAIAALHDYDGSDTAGTTTLLARLSALWAAQLDAAVSTRLAAADYTAPDNAGIADIPTNAEFTNALAALNDFDPSTDKVDLVDAPNATALVAMAVALLDTLLSAGDADALNARTVRSALRAIRNKSGTVGGTLTVCKEDDTAAAWTAAVTEDASAEPITEIDPA